MSWQDLTWGKLEQRLSWAELNWAKMSNLKLTYATLSFKRNIKQERTRFSNRRLFPIRRHRTIDKLTNCRAFCNNNNNLKYLVLMNNDQILCTQIYVFVLNHKRMFHAYLIPFDAKARRNLEIMQLYNLVKHDLTLKKKTVSLCSHRWVITSKYL